MSAAELMAGCQTSHHSVFIHDYFITTVLQFYQFSDTLLNLRITEMSFLICDWPATFSEMYRLQLR